MKFTEDLLHYVWKSGMLLAHQLQTNSGDLLKIIQPGIANYHSGPDFQNALLRIGKTKWAGTIEMHLQSSDWYKHQHQDDEAYENVILHVVYEHDRAVFRKDGTEIPVLALKDLIPNQLLNTYRDLISSKNWIPCVPAIQSVDHIFITSWLNRILIERLELKSNEVISLVKELKGSWDDAFYITLARNFGFKNNALPFECLARSLPQHLLARHKNQALQIEALLFGQSGMLANEFEDSYPNQLRSEYQFLSKKYHLNALDESIWKFMRLRPANFPSIRLAQFAALVLKSYHLFSQILEISDLKLLRHLFSDLPVNSYWKTHFRFDKSSDQHTIQPGIGSLDNLLINSVAVFLFAYGRFHQVETYRLRALKLLEEIAAEKNQVVNQFRNLGIIVANAAETQSLLQLKRNYCDEKKCLSCGIGNQILNKKSP